MRSFMVIPALIFAAIFLSSAVHAQESRLQSIEHTVHTAQPSGGYHPDCDPDDFPYFDPFFFSPVYYHPYPLIYLSPPIAAVETPPPGPSIALLSGFHYLYDIEGDLDGFRGTLKLRTPIGSFDGDFTRFRERLESGHYYLNLYYLDYLFALTLDPAVLEFGFGLTGLQGVYSQDGGNLSCSLQVAPLNPLILDAAARYSNVHDSPITDLSAGVGAIYRFLELRVGYRYIFFEGPDIRGPEFSVRLWF
jgi:hypothetical protein